MRPIRSGSGCDVAALVLLLGACAPWSEPPGASAAMAAADDPPAAVLQDALETLPSGEAVRWRVADSARGGTVQPVRTFRTAQGFCREYAVTLTEPDGSGRAWREVACRDPDGVWQAVAGGA